MNKITKLSCLGLDFVWDLPGKIKQGKFLAMPYSRIRITDMKKGDFKLNVFL